jgi:Ca-activated chloride channel family protein
MASTTEGAYFNAGNRGELDHIYQRLDELETHKVETMSYRPKQDLFHWPLGVLVVLSLLYYGVVVMRQGLRNARRQRDNALAMAGTLTLLSFFLLSANTGSSAISQFHFLRPWWLLAIIPTCGLTFLIWRRQDAQRQWQQIIAPHLLNHLLVGGEPRRQVRPVHVLLAVWLITIMALAGPTWRREPSPFTADQAALAIVIEVTPTMQAQDIQPSRQQRAAQKVRDLLALRPGAKTALIAYAGSAHRVMPMTQDARIIDMFADQLFPNMMPRTGDVAAEALTLADEQIRSAQQPGSIVWMTDGVEANQLDGLKTYRKRDGAPIHLLAVAGDAGLPLPPDSPPAPALDRSALKRAADAVDGTLTVISPDDRDVRQLSRLVETQFVAAQATEGGSRWQDMGYWLTPLICLLMLIWFRPGWVVQDVS